ncbi:MAG: hydrolase [Acidimicrobiia bacterium]|nr:hydrolase [Acidimicrobiia bacterium]
MRREARLGVMAALAAAASLLVPPSPHASGADAPALCGVAAAQGEGRLEGVLVTARRKEASFSVTVSTNEQGRYCFPRSHLQPGEYALRIRATGYDLEGSPRADVKADRQATVDLKLGKTRDLAAQLTSQEWIISATGTREQKKAMQRQVINCNFCHTLERVLRTRYTAEQWMPVIARMNSYHPDYSGSVLVQKWRGMTGADTWWTNPAGDLASYLASINLSQGGTWAYPLRPLPRPTGRATRAIITVYDIPKQPNVIHDLDVDASGIVWYGHSGYDLLGRLDPKTATFTDYPAPNYSTQQGGVVGLMDVQADRDGGVWANVQGPKLARFDTRSLTWRSFDLPRSAGAFLAPFRAPNTTTVWTHSALRLDVATGRVDEFDWRTQLTGPHTLYMVDRDSQDNAYFPDYGRFGYGNSGITRIDGKTGVATFYPTPTPDAFPRRGYIDAQDRFWFGEFFGDKIGMFDTRAERFQEFPTQHPFSSPYNARPDKHGNVWASSHGTDRLLRLDPKTGQILEYLMPVYYDARKIVTDNATERATIWLPNKNTAQLIRIEPLD